MTAAPVCREGAGADTVTAKVLRVATLNIAHGRKDSRNQALVAVSDHYAVLANMRPAGTN